MSSAVLSSRNSIGRQRRRELRTHGHNAGKWTHEGMDLTDEMINLNENAGVLDAKTGSHLQGSEGEGRIPIICKRNFLRNYRKVCLLAGAGMPFVHGKSYMEH